MAPWPLGVARSVPLMHGSQVAPPLPRCFVRHFREPVPLQTTAMDQVSSVMGADDNIVEALKSSAEKNPALVGSGHHRPCRDPGADINRAVGGFACASPVRPNRCGGGEHP